MKKYMLKCEGYDLFVIDSRNADTTQEQLPDCIKDVIEQIMGHLKELEESKNETAQ